MLESGDGKSARSLLRSTAVRWFLLLLLCSCRSCTYDPDAPPADDEGLFQEPEEQSDQVWNVGEYRVHERVVLHFGFPDNTFERTYRVYDDGVWHPLGGVHDEEDVAMRESASPLVIDDRLFVFVGATTLTYAPGSGAKRITPYDASNFDECDLNGHYDLRAGSVAIEGTSWTIQYAPARSGTPMSLRSEDGGRTWTADC